MKKQFTHASILGMATIALSMTTIGKVLAAPQPADLEDIEPMTQVTSVTQLTDVKPSDWAFQALQSLV